MTSKADLTQLDPDQLRTFATELMQKTGFKGSEPFYTLTPYYRRNII